MTKLLLLFFTFVLGLLFLLLPTTGPMDFFLFSNAKLTFQTHVYFICEKLVLIIMAWVIAAEEQQYRKTLQVFFWLLVVDLLDYLLTYGSIWFYLWSFPISMNVAKVVIFGLVISKVWIKTHSDR